MANVKIKAKKRASNNLDLGWTPPPPPLWGMSKYEQIFIPSCFPTYNTQSNMIILTPSVQVPNVVTECRTDLNWKVVEGLVEGSD